MGSAQRNEEAAVPVSAVPPQNDEPVDPARSPTASLADLPVAKDDDPEERPGGSAGRGARGPDRDLQLVFTNVLLSVVGAYGVTGSVAVTVIAAVIALLVTAVVARRR